MGAALPASRRARVRATTSTLLASALLLAGCGADVDGDELATATPASTATAPASETPTSSEPAGEAAGTNLTDGCVEEYDPDADYFPEKVSFDEATGVRVEYAGNHKVVEVDVPYAEEGAPPFTAVLVQCGTPAPELTGELEGAAVVEVPTDDVVSLTTVNLPHFEALDALDHLAGVATSAFVSTPAVRDEIASRELEDLADANGVPDRERIISTAPDLLVLDAFGATLLDDVRGFADAGVPTVLNADFGEETPLGRAEWLKYTALFLNEEAAATATYDDIVASYEDTAATVADVEERPTVLLEQPFEGTWYAPTGGSFVAQLVADAGGDYVFADTPGSGTQSLDIEAVLAEGGDADVWIGAGSVNGSLADLAAVDERFAELAAFRDGEVWALDAGNVESGGNPIYELAVMRPDLQLRDLVAVLHPDLLPDHDQRFYGRVPAGG
jgi:iron complex transport system substrate-binding protein